MNDGDVGTGAAQTLRFMACVREAVRRRRYSPRTAEADRAWVRRYVLFHGRRHPRERVTEELAGFRSHRANVERVRASTQNQAIAALLFWYCEVLGVRLERVEERAGAAASPVRDGASAGGVGGGAGSGIEKRVGRRARWDLVARQRLEGGYDIRTIQEIIGRSNVRMTMIYTHVLNRKARGVESPRDRAMGMNGRLGMGR